MENIIHNKKNIGKLFCSNYDYNAVNQLRSISERAGFSYLYAFPDLHAGEIPVGHVTRTAGIVYYDIIGADIGCSVSSFPIIYNTKTFNPDLVANYVLDNFTGKGKMPSIGNGNHFFEISTDEEGHIYFVIHTGSRRYGAEMYKEIEKELKILGLKGVPIASTNLFHTLHAKFLNSKHYARKNTDAIINALLNKFNLDIDSNAKYKTIRTVHNTIRVHDGVVDHYKGASVVSDGECAVIPISMKEGSLVVRSISTSKLFNAINHGAGRVLSRKQAKSVLDKNALDGINVLSRNDVTDEAPQAYKNIDTDMQELVDLGYIEILGRLKPIITVKE